MHVDSADLKKDYMGLLGRFGVHVPNSLLPEGRYRIRSVRNRYTSVFYGCRSCGHVSDYRGKTNRCPVCGARRTSSRTRPLRKALLWFALRFLRWCVSFDYHCDPDYDARCPLCGTYLNYDYYEEGLFCWRCGYFEHYREMDPELKQAIREVAL